MVDNYNAFLCQHQKKEKEFEKQKKRDEIIRKGCIVGKRMKDEKKLRIEKNGSYDCGIAFLEYKSFSFQWP